MISVLSTASSVEAAGAVSVESKVCMLCMFSFCANSSLSTLDLAEDSCWKLLNKYTFISSAVQFVEVHTMNGVRYVCVCVCVCMCMCTYVYNMLMSDSSTHCHQNNPVFKTKH